MPRLVIKRKNLSSANSRRASTVVTHSPSSSGSRLLICTPLAVRLPSGTWCTLSWCMRPLLVNRQRYWWLVVVRNSCT